MAIALLLSTTSNNWHGVYPFDWKFNHDATGASCLLVFFYSSDDVPWTPTATYGGVNMTLIASAHGGANKGTIWAWALNNPASGVNQVEVSMPNNYGPDGVGYAVNLANTHVSTPIGPAAAACGPTSTPLSITLADTGDLVVGFAVGYFSPTPSFTGVPQPTQVDTNVVNSNLPAEIIRQTAGNVGTTDTITFTVPYNNANAVIVEVRNPPTGQALAAGPLTVHPTLSPATIVAPQSIRAAPLQVGVGFGPATVARGVGVPQAITAGPLATVAALVPPSIVVGTAPVDVTPPVTLVPGQNLRINVEFTPTAAGARSGVLTLLGATNTTIGLSGAGSDVPPLLRLSTQGNQIVDSDGNPVRLRSVNWFGAESSNFIPHGIWSRKWTDILQQIKTFGFNCVRLPFSDSILNDANKPNGIDTAQNPDLVGLTPLQIMDKIIAYGASIGLRFVLDQHRTAAGTGTDGWPPASGDGGYTTTMWQTTWIALANRYGNTPAVCGFDPHNEPYQPTWSRWAGMVETLANAVHTVAPDWLVFCEGVGSYNNDSYWWGGQLAGVKDRPVVLNQPHKLVYSPHEYGQSVAAGQPWLAYDGQTPPTNWPNNLPAKWDSVWGFIPKQNIAPIWIGEFGGHFGYNGSGVDHSTPNRDTERQWLSQLISYLNTNGAQHFSFWAYNCNSGDTGGLMQDDWVTPQSGKLALLQGLLT